MTICLKVISMKQIQSLKLYESTGLLRKDLDFVNSFTVDLNDASSTDKIARYANIKKQLDSFNIPSASLLPLQKAVAKKDFDLRNSLESSLQSLSDNLNGSSKKANLGYDALEKVQYVNQLFHLSGLHSPSVRSLENQVTYDAKLHIGNHSSSKKKKLSSTYRSKFSFGNKAITTGLFILGFAAGMGINVLIHEIFDKPKSGLEYYVKPVPENNYKNIPYQKARDEGDSFLNSDTLDIVLSK